jgi:hypothetical protein
MYEERPKHSALTFPLSPFPIFKPVLPPPSERVSVSPSSHPQSVLPRALSTRPQVESFAASQVYGNILEIYRFSHCVYCPSQMSESAECQEDRFVSTAPITIFHMSIQKQ